MEDDLAEFVRRPNAAAGEVGQVVEPAEGAVQLAGRKLAAGAQRRCAAFVHGVVTVWGTVRVPSRRKRFCRSAKGAIQPCAVVIRPDWLTAAFSLVTGSGMATPVEDVLIASGVPV